MVRNMLLIAAAMLIYFPQTLFAGSFGIPMQGQRYVGMGNIGTGLSLDAATIFYNPGGLAMLEQKGSISLGVSTSFLKNEFTSDTFRDASADNPISTPFHLYASYKINDQLAVGLGVYTPYGNSVDWGTEWSGRYLIHSIDLEGIYAQPTISWRPFEKLSIGGGPIIAYGHIKLSRGQYLTTFLGDNPDGTVTLEGSTIGYGFNVGAMYQITDKLQVGLRYLSKVQMEIDGGDADFNDFQPLFSDLEPPIVQNFDTPDTMNSFSSSLPLPSKTSLGISYEFSDDFRMGLDVTYVGWGAYDSLIIEFENEEEFEAAGNATSFPPDSREPRHYDNTFIVKLGGEYDVSDVLTIRAGLSYDQTPIQRNLYTPETPDNDKLGASVGISVSPTDWLTIDGSFAYLYGIEQEFSYEPSSDVSGLYSDHPYDGNTFRGKMKTDVFLPGLGVTMKF